MRIPTQIYSHDCDLHTTANTAFILVFVAYLRSVLNLLMRKHIMPVSNESRCHIFAHPYTCMCISDHLPPGQTMDMRLIFINLILYRHMVVCADTTLITVKGEFTSVFHKCHEATAYGQIWVFATCKCKSNIRMHVVNDGKCRYSHTFTTRLHTITNHTFRAVFSTACGIYLFRSAFIFQ